MRRQFLPVATILTFSFLIPALLLSFQAVSEPARGSQEGQAGAEVFAANKVWALHLEVAAKEYVAMQPPAGGGFGPGGPVQPPKGKADAGDRRPSERNLFGMEFPWAQGELTALGKTYKKVGVRYAGDAQYLAAARNLKRPLRVELSRFENQQLDGLQNLNLHGGALDATRARETLAYAVFREAGVPAPRSALAEVTLTVPGKYDKELLGLYTLVEDVDKAFLERHFKSARGLVLKPARMRGLDYLGDDWDKYKGNYQPRSEPTKEQAKRVIDFARLVNQAGDAQFAKEIDSYLDVDEFLRFAAANALVSNLESFLALGSNYYLYLHEGSNKFVFIPGDLELSFANFAFMGSADQQMDLSLSHPYPGENKLADRLLAIKGIKERYEKLLKELSSTCFTKEPLLKEIEALEKTTKEPLAREAKATAARKEGPPGFGPPGGKGPQAPDLRAFVEKRTVSVTAQLAGKSKGFVPQFGFGPPGGGGGPQFGKGPQTPVNDKMVQDLVKAPPEFEVTLFAAPPMVGYPVAVTAAPTGEVFVAVDEQGSLGRTPGGGKVIRLLDPKGEGKSTKSTVFAKMEHPRGVVYDGGALWVLHPPLLSVFHDNDGDGVADRQDALVTGLTTDMIDKRGGDHTTNGIRLGIDGWIYICVGDYGIKEARGKDGRALSLRGGGILRVRPDGTDLEVFATGIRNTFDLAIDPYLNLFARDNTNDGGGWDTRVHHFVQSAHFGYTQLYANFTEETMPPLGEFGSGGATGALWLQHPAWPEKYRDTLYTGDWGRNEVYQHPLRPHGATFDLEQKVFLKMPRPTGMDMDLDGNLYVNSWRGGEASVYVGPNVGFVARVTPKGLKPAAAPKLKEADLTQLVRNLSEPSAPLRLHSQREIIRRGPSAEATKALAALATDGAAPVPGRVAAIFALKQLDATKSVPLLVKLTTDATVREFALRALTDRKSEMAGLDPKLFVAALDDASARVQAQALISLGRLNDVAAAKAIVPFTVRPKGSALPTKKPVWAQPDPDRVLPHLAMRALVSLNAADACLEALDGPYSDGALLALRNLHDARAVDGLIKKLGSARDTDLRKAILATLIRLYYREADYTGSWWGIRPESIGPYWDRQEWELSQRIAAVVTSAVLDGDALTVAYLRKELSRHRVSLPGLPSANDTTTVEKETPITVAKADPKNPDQVGNMPYEVAVKRTLDAKGDATNGKLLFKSQSCFACHTDADGQSPKGPHLVEIGKRYSGAEILESILKPSAKIAQGFETYTFLMTDGRQFTGFVVTQSAKTLKIRESTGIQRELNLAEIDSRQIQQQSAMPDGLVSNMTPGQLADLLAYLQSLK
jgi:putative membrane-bound dehydrogenase-like protein